MPADMFLHVRNTPYRLSKNMDHLEEFGWEQSALLDVILGVATGMILFHD
jgi:hypothetical protein